MTAAIIKLINHLIYPQDFVFQEKKYFYFDHSYNDTKNNERAVEIPIIFAQLANAAPQKTLEVGNVLSHYFTVSHDIVDKYEKAKRVMNCDILKYTLKKKYDLIVSISTLEHVGWDEFPRNKKKIPMTLKHLYSLLTPHGKLIFTVPVAINDYLDQALHAHSLPLTEVRCLKRVSKHKWEEKSWEQIRFCKYDEPFPNANGIVIGTIQKK